MGILFVIVPGNASIFLKTIIEMVTFDPVPDLEPHIATVFSLTHDDEIEPDLGARFEAMGYETVFMLEAMGSLTFIIMLQLAVIPLFILGSICCVCSSKCRTWFKVKVNGIFFNAILALVDGIFLPFVLASVINIKSAMKG